MRVTLCASPDAGWPVLSEFLARSTDRLVIAMYHFTAPHVYQALHRTLLAAPDSALHMVRHPKLGEGGTGTKADDLDGETVMKRLRKALGDRLEFVRTTVGKGGVFGSAYHIKVAVADSKRFWLSSGNWQSTNQPPFDPIGAPDDLPTSYARKYNREYHAVIEHAGLAKTFEAYIEYDLKVARQEPPAAFDVPDVAVPIEPELPDDFAPARWFRPLELHREIKVQPVLTPDNYADVVRALIQRAQRSIWFQNQYINLLERDNFEAFRNLVDALLAKQQAGLDVRIICRDGMEPRKIDILLAAGFESDRLRFQAACHNKTIIVDEAEVLIGSHNWSNDGTVSNRDASLLFFDEEIAKYFGEIYQYDWERARSKVRRRQPRLLRDGEAPPAGTERAPFGDLFEDGDVLPAAPATVKPPRTGRAGGRLDFGVAEPLAASPAPAPQPPAEPAPPPTELFPSGVDEATGKLLAEKIDVARLAAAIRQRGAQALSPAVAAANVRAGLESLGLPFGVTADNLEGAGWAVVFADDVAPAIREQLRPLLDRRRAQAGRRYKELEYRRGESVRDWLGRHGVDLSNITPSKVPYHLMLVGAPASLPFELQYQLDLVYSVGRLWFDEDNGFGRYAASVVAYETGAAVPTVKEVAYFGPSGDQATALSSQYLLTPLRDGTDEDAAVAGEYGFKVSSFIGAGAKKTALVQLLHDGARRPAFLFTAGHGLRCAINAQKQRQNQGALVTAEHLPGAALDTATMALTASDIRDDAAIHGLVAFVFACYGAGTPERDQFPQSPDSLGAPEPIAPAPFIAALPQRLLGHPAGGALAVIGHVERAWEYSITPPRLGPQILPFRNAIARILAGQPVGEATTDLTGRHAALAAEMVSLLGPNGPHLDDYALVVRWIEQNDARNYILLGDPAVRLRSADMRGAEP